MTLSRTPNHVEQALGRFLSQFKEKPNLSAWSAAFVEEIQEIEDAFHQLFTQRLLRNAVGKQLDVIGRLVGRERLGLDDTSYRPVLFAWIRANRSNGTGNDIIEVVQLALVDAGIIFTPLYPASFVVEVSDTLSMDAALLASLITKARLAGVNGQLVYSTSPLASSFLFAPGDAEVVSTTQGTASGDSDSTGTGGMLAEVAEA